MSKLIEIKGVSKSYGDEPVLHNLNLYIRDKEFITLLGPSGCGKTTILSLAAGLLSPTKGSVKSFDVSFGYMLQKDELFPWRTIEKNIFLPLEIKCSNTPEHRERAIALAEKYGLKQFLKNYPSSLSGGMRQRAALIRTLSVDPDVLLLDEPTRGVDIEAKQQIYRIVRELAAEGKSVVFISSEVEELPLVCDRILLLQHGTFSQEFHAPVNVDELMSAILSVH